MNWVLYTWSNKQNPLALEKLDRILMYSDLENLFPFGYSKMSCEGII
jgi:hypothetical protein